MTNSPSKFGDGDDKAKETGLGCRRLWYVLGGLLLLAFAALAFVGYSQPEMLLDYVNLRYCG